MIRALLAVLLLCGLAACGQRPDASPSASPSPGAKPALWSVEDREGAARGWLFGTIHALPDDAQWETPAISSAMQDAGLLVVEVRDLDPQRIGATLATKAQDEPVPPLARRLAPAGQRRLAALLAEKGAAASQFDGLETWAAALALSRLAEGVSAGNGVDRAVIDRFAGRPILELEGAAYQLAIFDALPEGDQRSLLTAVLDEQQDPAADAKRLADAWLAGDLAALEQTTRRGLLADPALYKALAADRNLAWMRKLVPLLKGERRPLVAVGTAHLIGPDGLPALLAKRGYRIRRLQ